VSFDHRQTGIMSADATHSPAIAQSSLRRCKAKSLSPQ
jgi:hypothetical protein